MKAGEVFPLTPYERRAYAVVDLFEQELCNFTGAPFAVATNSCTNAIQLALTWERLNVGTEWLRLPRRTYIGVLQAALRAGYDIVWDDQGDNWQQRGWYALWPTGVIDAARDLQAGCYKRDYQVCVSFHSAKQLPSGRGGALLTNLEELADWARAARMDGRTPGDTKPPIIGNTLHCPMPPDVAARGLDILSRWTEPPAPLPHTEYPDLSQWYPGV